MLVSHKVHIYGFIMSVIPSKGILFALWHHCPSLDLASCLAHCSLCS